MGGEGGFLVRLETYVARDLHDFVVEFAEKLAGENMAFASSEVES